MLSLQLKSSEYLTIGDNIAVQIFEQSGSSFRVAVKAPREIPVLRGEVHERTGMRPDGLRSKRPQSPSERRYSAKHFEEWVEKRERREEQFRLAEEEKTSVMRELTEIADNLDALVAAHGGIGVQGRLKELCARLVDMEAAQSSGQRGGSTL